MDTANVRIKPKRLYSACKHCGSGSRGRVCRQCHRDGTARFTDNRPAEPVGSVLNSLREKHRARFNEQIVRVEQQNEARVNDLADKLRSAWGVVKSNRRGQH